jgi:NAD(P)-dependent dehydrogenase (short-subunit alcohol dehydrogenase family)
MTQLIPGQRALVTGGGTGLGYAIAQRLLEHGAHVLIVGRREDVLKEAVAQLESVVRGGSIAHQVCDVTDDDQLAAAVHTAGGDGGTLDIMVANAGTAMPSPIATLTADLWRYVTDINLTGTALSIKHGAAAMKAGGSIITMSSTAAIKVEKWMSTYTATKAAIEMLTKCAAFEYAPQGIRVNCLQPGWHTTEMNETSFTPQMRDAVIANTLLGRPGEPEEIGDAVVWLSSPMASFVTGQVIGIDGGLGVPLGEDFQHFARMIAGDDQLDRLIGSPRQ